MHKKVLEMAGVRAAECSNGTLTLDQLGPADKEACLLAAEDEYIFLEGQKAERDQERVDYFRAKQRGEDV